LSCLPRGDAAEDIVGRQLDAYNAKDLDAFMACWADDARIWAWPDTLLADGADAIRERHRTRFLEPDLHAALSSRVSVDGLVVDREVVTRNFADGPADVDVIGIYDVRDGLIRQVWFKQDEPRSQTPVCLPS